jgi:Mce-associated membrane protein
MPPRKRTSSVLNGDAKDHPKDADEATTPDDALTLAEEAEAEAAEAEAMAAAARARARAIRLRRQAAAATAASVPVAGASNGAATAVTAVAVDDAAPADVAQITVAELDELAAPDSDAEVDADDSGSADSSDDPEDSGEDIDAEPTRRRRLKLPRIGVKTIAAALVVLLSLGLLGLGGWMVWHHQQVAAEQQRSAEFAAAARQGVVTLMSLDFNHAEDNVKRILENTTGDFRKDFEGQADEFIGVAKQSKVTTQATVNSTAVQTMTKDTATVLVAVTTNVSNAASKEQEPRSWRLRVDMARDGGQLKLAKVEFVP